MRSPVQSRLPLQREPASYDFRNLPVPFLPCSRLSSLLAKRRIITFFIIIKEVYEKKVVPLHTILYHDRQTILGRDSSFSKFLRTPLGADAIG